MLLARNLIIWLSFPVPTSKPIYLGNYFFRYGKLWDVYPRLLKEKDPSEGIRSDEIIPTVNKAFKENEAKKDNCGTAIPANKEVGVQRTDVKLKSDE